MNQASKHICVCICTYRRPQLLRRLLDQLQHQKTKGLLTYSVVVIDNDFNQTARPVFESLAGTMKIDIEYYVEGEQNIALARNKAVEKANGDFIAFIDDDEFPSEEWLSSLYEASRIFKADGVLGPVRPHFETEAPAWVVKGRLCERRSFQTGYAIKKSENTRTGNVLLDKRLFDGIDAPFDPRFGKTGGEDVDFFERMMQKGKMFVWCNEAYVSETVPPERLERSYFLRRALLRGVANSKKVSFLSMDVLKSAAAIVLYAPLLPVFLLRHHLFMKYLIKECDHLGKLLAVCGFEVVKERAS